MRKKPSATIRKYSTTRPQEILKKSSLRKNKALFVFPGLVDVVQEGVFGQVSNMDTNPILDVEFPSGEIRV